MACKLSFLLTLFFIIYTPSIIYCAISDIAETSSTSCTYFGERLSSPEGNLVNCSWYSNNACCKRTEVTSVFGSMYPLYGASGECANQMNYLMCYFCSPEQYRWYHKRLKVCSDFCTSVYKTCIEAQFKGRALGEVYTSGEAFCQGQKFEVASNTQECFDFDPTVFSSASLNIPKISVTVFVLFIIASYNTYHT